MNFVDIVNIFVLKDVVLFVIYGLCVVFGVILVIIKDGSNEKFIVNYNNNFVLCINICMLEIIIDFYLVVIIWNMMVYLWYNFYNEE